MKKKKIKKFDNFLKEELSIYNMELGLDLTKLRSNDFVSKKTAEYIKENKHE